MKKDQSYLKNLKKESVVQQVINCLTDGMVSKQLKPGDRIPSEPELASTLGVARTSVREATKILTYLGVLESRRAEGTFVTSGFKESMIDPMVYGVILNQDDDFTNLMELREMMEAGMLRLAMSKHTEEDMRSVREKLQKMETLEDQGGDVYDVFFEVDNEFHDAVSALCDNPLADKINRVVRVLTYSVRYDTVKTMITTGRIAELVDAHRQIYEVLRGRNQEDLDVVVRHTYFLDL
ncbi:MAG: FCD domain-containing protein [Peptoniphilaceae bacterium]|nr:FCD domain-containing protein [Peptoniphilaceae bacterium]